MENKILTTRGYAIKKDYIGHDKVLEACKDLTMQPRNKMTSRGAGSPPFPIYMESSSRLYLPRAWAIERFGPPDIDIVPAGASMPDTVQFAGEPRDYQIPIINKFLNAGSNGLLCTKTQLRKIHLALAPLAGRYQGGP